MLEDREPIAVGDRVHVSSRGVSGVVVGNMLVESSGEHMMTVRLPDGEEVVEPAQRLTLHLED